MTTLTGKWLALTPAMLIIAVCVECGAEDIVTLSAADGQSRTRLTGTILDYNGKELQLQRSIGGVTKVPSTQVIDIDTQWTAEHADADKLLADAKYAEALDRYREALSAEPRLWVQRQIVAQRVWCLQALGRHERACIEFLRLSNADPTDQYLQAIPLSWSPGEPSLSMEREAKAWLQSDRSVERLIGASWLLSVQRGDALTELQRLSSSDDARVAYLATAQIWQTQIATASPDKLATWQQQIQRMPRELRAGPFFTLARALAYKKEHQPAALTYLHVPILYPQDRGLAAAALREAAGQLEQMDLRNEAIGLYRELIDDYAAFPQAADAAARLQALSAGDNN